VEEIEQIRAPGLFILDDVAFIQAEHGLAIGEAIARKGIQKRYWLETRADVLLRNKEVFQLWSRLGLKTMFIGIEAIDEDGLKKFRKRVSFSKNFEALEFARSLGVNVAINIIADPEWDRERFRVVREWCMEIPEVVNISVNTPYPGTETWCTESRQLTTRDYRLFDIQHAVLPTRLPLPDFYTELVQTQQVLNHKHLGAKQLLGVGRTVTRLLAHGQTNFLRMLFKFNSVYDPRLQLADHARPVKYEIALPAEPRPRLDRTALYVHRAQGRHGREIDNATEQFVDDTRMGTAE
jgi:hopanoid C-3 methylase HpnR